MPNYTPEQLHWKAVARKIADEVVRPLAKKYDDLQQYPWEIKEAMAKAGLMSVWLPKEYGGAGAGVGSLCVVVEELSRACGGVGVAYAVNALGSFPILLGGTEEQKKKWLPLIAKGEKLIAFGLSEKFAGSDAGSMRTWAKQDGDQWVINGEKKWCTNGGSADLFSVFCVTDPESKAKRISALLVEKGTPGFTLGKYEDKMGIRAVPVNELHFQNCRVPNANLLGGKPGHGFKHAMHTLDYARPGVAAQAVGLAQGALELSTLYAQRRQQFGVQISAHQSIGFMLAQMATKIEASRLLVTEAARLVDAKAENITKLAAMCKYFATETAMEVTTNAVQIFGGYGYMKDYPIEKYMRDAKITQIYEGTNQVQQMVIVRNVIKESLEWDYLAKWIPTETMTGGLEPAPVDATKK
ncbi:MAG: acyl-CoA dehydrogenase family protein [Candidatus Brocadiae bacterium]|nr:acyl-CoA dehydrogenase family protein [Candidatus Brocadiia bacterium]